MSAHNHFQDAAKAIKSGFNKIEDPGDGGTISIGQSNYTICEIVTSGAETRTLPDPTDLATGMEVLLTMKTDGGNCTVSATGNSFSSVILTTAGGHAKLFVVDIDGTLKWKSMSANGATFS